MACHGIPFTGYMAWNYLDLGPVGIEKELEGLDLSINGNADISIGWDQREGQEALATPAYRINGDTLPGMGMLPFPMSAPSFQFRLTFTAERPWEWFTLNAYKPGEGPT